MNGFQGIWIDCLQTLFNARIKRKEKTATLLPTPRRVNADVGSTRPLPLSPRLNVIFFISLIWYNLLHFANNVTSKWGFQNTMHTQIHWPLKVEVKKTGWQLQRIDFLAHGFTAHSFILVEHQCMSNYGELFNWGIIMQYFKWRTNVPHYVHCFANAIDVFYILLCNTCLV